MKQATAWPRRIAQHLTRSWHHRGRLGRRHAASLALIAALPCAVITSLILGPFTSITTAHSSPALVGRSVPASQLPAIKTAAASCPELTPPRLAAQLMAASGFNPRARSAGGRSGVAGLTAAQWKQWIPAPGDQRSNVTANILALAHAVCDLAGQARAANLHGDLWRLALAAFRAGMRAVTAARGIPPSAARYVNTVVGYAAWYAQQRQFGGKGKAATRPASHPTSQPSPAATTPASRPATPASTTGASTTPASRPSPTPTTPASRPSPSPTPAPLADGTYYIENRHSGDVIDIPEADSTEGIVLDQWPRNGGTNQQWRVRSLGRGIYRITSAMDGQVIDIFELSHSSGASVDQWPYWGGPNQKFRITPASGGYYTITNINSGKAVQVPGSSTTAGTSLDQGTPDGGTNQLWLFQPAG